MQYGAHLGVAGGAHKALERAVSVSSNRSTTRPPWPRAKSQLKSIVRTVPTWKSPVGLGGMRTQTGRDTADQSRW